MCSHVEVAPTEPDNPPIDTASLWWDSVLVCDFRFFVIVRVWFVVSDFGVLVPAPSLQRTRIHSIGFRSSLSLKTLQREGAGIFLTICEKGVPMSLLVVRVRLHVFAVSLEVVFPVAEIGTGESTIEHADRS
jgi:hypothetical protein